MVGGLKCPIRGNGAALKGRSHHQKRTQRFRQAGLLATHRSIRPRSLGWLLLSIRMKKPAEKFCDAARRRETAKRNHYISLARRSACGRVDDVVDGRNAGLVLQPAPASRFYTIRAAKLVGPGVEKPARCDRLTTVFSAIRNLQYLN